MLLINFFGAPGAGKTEAAHALCASLNKLKVPVEFSPQKSREPNYSDNESVLNDELYLLAEKNHRLHELKRSGVEVAISDSPILNSLVYMAADQYHEGFIDVICSIYESYTNVNIYIPGVQSCFGNQESLSESIAKGVVIEEMLDSSGVDFFKCSIEKDRNDHILNYVITQVSPQIKRPSTKLLDVNESLQPRKKSYKM